MAITYLDNAAPASASRIVYLDRPEQTTWEATKAALGSRPELRPYTAPDEIPEQPESALSGALSAARETLTAPIRAGATVNRAFGFPEDIGNATGFPETGKMVSNVLPFFVGPGGKTPLPKAGIGREAAVAAADELAIPLSRADRTGSAAAGGLEAALEKTPLGSGVIRNARKATSDAAESVKNRYSREMGTAESSSSVGMKAREGYTSKMEAARGARDQAYDQVPQEVSVPLKNAISTADEIIQEQSQYLPTTRNADVIALAKDIQNAERGISSGEGVTGGPEVKGITVDIPSREIPASTRNVQSSLVDAQGNPLSFAENVPGKKVAASKEYGVSHQFGPEEKFASKPNYPLLSRLRSVLGDKIEANTVTKSDGSRTLTQAGRDFARLKASLEKDIGSFAEEDASGFGETYRGATANAKEFAGTYQNQDVKRMLFTDPEKVVDSIFRPNNITEIQRFRAAVGEEPFLLAKRQFTQSLLDGKNLKAGLDKHSEILGTVYTPTEIQKLSKLADVLDLVNKSQRSFENPSGTARQIVGGGSWSAAAYAIGAGHPGAALSIIGLPYLASKALVRSAKGIPNPTARLATGAGLDVGRR